MEPVFYVIYLEGNLDCSFIFNNEKDANEYYNSYSHQHPMSPVKAQTMTQVRQRMLGE